MTCLRSPSLRMQSWDSSGASICPQSPHPRENAQAGAPWGLLPGCNPPHPSDSMCFADSNCLCRKAKRARGRRARTPALCRGAEQREPSWKRIGLGGLCKMSCQFLHPENERAGPDDPSGTSSPEAACIVGLWGLGH